MTEHTTVIAIVQARMGSTRLPGKVLMPLAGIPVLTHVLNRVKAAARISGVMIATTLSAVDDPVADLAKQSGVEVYRGSENDVLDRYYQAALRYNPGHIVRITADCPLMDPAVIDLVIERHLAEGADYTTNTFLPTYPDGEDVEVFTFTALARAWREARLPSEREHVTPFLRVPGRFRTASVTIEPAVNKRWTLDEQSDYEFISGIYAELYDSSRPLFGMKEILSLLQRQPEREHVNNSISRNEGYQRSLRNDPRQETSQ